jgi:cytochrome c peroxidase
VNNQQGECAILPEAVRIMARVQLGQTISDDDTKEIVTFLKCLTGELPENIPEYLQPLLS